MLKIILEFLNKYIKNLISFGLIITLLLTILDYIHTKKNIVAYFAFLSGSWFLSNLLNYYKISSMNGTGKMHKIIDYIYIKNNIIGGLVWVLYALFMLFLYTLNVSSNMNIILTTLLIIIVTISSYFILPILNSNK